MNVSRQCCARFCCLPLVMMGMWIGADLTSSSFSGRGRRPDDPQEVPARLVFADGREETSFSCHNLPLEECLRCIFPFVIRVVGGADPYQCLLHPCKICRNDGGEPLFDDSIFLKTILI